MCKLKVISLCQTTVKKLFFKLFLDENGTCSCCPVCVKQKGEWCGGLNDEEGVCDTGLKCLKPYNHSVGQCYKPGERKCFVPCTLERCPDLHCDGRKISTVGTFFCHGKIFILFANSGFAETLLIAIGAKLVGPPQSDAFDLESIR